MLGNVLMNLGIGTSMIPVRPLAGPLRHVHTQAQSSGEEGSWVSYLALLRSPSLRCLIALTFLTEFVGYGQLEAGFPPYARQAGGPG